MFERRKYTFRSQSDIEWTIKAFCLGGLNENKLAIYDQNNFLYVYMRQDSKKLIEDMGT